MNSQDALQEQKQQFMQEIARQYGFSGKKWDVFYNRFNEGKQGLENDTIAESLWSEIVDRKQTFQDHLKGICDRLAEKGCPINGSKKRGKGRPRNEESPWRIAYQWLWETKFPEWRLQNSHSMPSVPDWFSVCTKMLAKQQEDQRIRRKITEMGFEVKVYVPLGLVERKQQQRRSGILPMEEVHHLKEEVITRTYKYDEFLKDVIGETSASKNKHIAIVGEPGAGKTTLLDAIATHIQKNTEDLPICISLGSLQGKKLKDYILEEWLPEAIALTYPDIDVETFHHNSLQKRLRQGGVWLLLDGVDEMGETSPAKALESIQNQLTNWLGNVRVVLTCRTNVWDAYLNNPLTGFDTYKTQHFDPADIRRFIKQWFEFAEKPELGKILRQKLNEPQRDRIRQLVENPLRLALLCQVFHKDKQAELPETKAGLYELFVRYFYEWKPTQSSIDLTTQPGLKEELHQALGRLSIAGLDSDARFRLPENLVQKEMGDRLFKLAWEIGWLNLVDREATSDDEPVYAFFHPTFQEYFAALAIDDWHFFLNHDNENPNPLIQYQNHNCVYRIFYSHWIEIASLWLDRKDIHPQYQKDALLWTLVNFNDGCGDFYEHSTFSLVYPSGLSHNNSELWELLYIDDEDGTPIFRIDSYWPTHSPYNWGSDQHFDFWAIYIEFVEWLGLSQSRLEYINISSKLANESDELAELVQIPISTLIEQLYYQGDVNVDIDCEAQKITDIELLVAWMGSEQNLAKRQIAFKLLSERLYKEPDVNNILVKALFTYDDDSIVRLLTWIIGDAGVINQNILNALVYLLMNTKDEFTFGVAGYSFYMLFYQLFCEIEWYGKKIDYQLFLSVIPEIKKLYLNIGKQKDIYKFFYCCSEVLWKLAQNINYPDFYRAWHSQSSITHPEAPDNIPASNYFITEKLTLTQKIQIIQSTVANDPTLKDTVQLICIDGSQFSDQNNPATDIYIEMIEQGCPEQQEEPSTMQELKKYWRLRLKTIEKRVALLFYNSKADREFSETFLTVLSTFGNGDAIAIITTQHCENVKLFDRNDPDLIDAVLKWLRRDILER